MSRSTTSKKESFNQFENTSPFFKFSAGQENFKLDVPLLSVFKPKRLSYTIIAFSNLVVGEKFLSLLEKEKEISVSIHSPSNFVDLFDVKEDSFSLDGFSEARSKAYEYCMEL